MAQSLLEEVTSLSKRLGDAKDALEREKITTKAYQELHRESTVTLQNQQKEMVRNALLVI